MKLCGSIPAARGHARRFHLRHPSLVGLLIGLSSSAVQGQTVCAVNVKFNDCGIPAGLWSTEVVTVTQTNTTADWFGVYLKWNQFKLNDLTVSTRGSGSDAVRTDAAGSWLFANRLTITTTGATADGINVASNDSGAYDSGVVIRDAAEITTTNGMGVRVNALNGVGGNSIAILPAHSTVRVIGTGTATQGTSTFSADAYGYGVYAGNRTYDMNNIGLSGALSGQNNNTLGNAYAFIGSDSTISTATRNGHAVYANKGGFVQLGDGVDVRTTGQGAYALYAATEQQGSYATNVRPGYIFLEGGATLRVTNGVAGSDGVNAIVMQANGADSIIANRALDISDLDYTLTGSFNSRMINPPDKTAWTATSGVFDVMGVMDARAGGKIDLRMSDGSRFIGATAMTGANSAIDLDMTGPTSQWQIAANSTLRTLRLNDGATLKPYRAADEVTAFQLTGALANAGGVVDLKNGVAGETLTLNGDYAASGDAWLRLDTVLGDSSSLSDKLVINNGSVSGSTQVAVTNAGGLGALTTGDGIPIVETHSATIGPGAGFWAPTNSIQAGLYAYNVVRGTEAPENWYLTSELKPTEPPEPPPPTEPPGPMEPPAPPSIATPSVPNIRNAVPVYMTAPALAGKFGLAMLGTYHDRVGEDPTDALLRAQEPAEEWCGAGENRYRCPTHRAGWGRVFGESGSVGQGARGSLQGRLDRFDRHGPSYDYDLSGFQVGLDLHRKEREDGIRDIAGLYVGHGNIDADVQGVYGGRAGTMSMDGYSLGGYWTRKGASNWYIDGVAQYTMHGNVEGATVDGYRLKTDGHVLTASLEGGHPFALGNDWTLEPQAQLIWQRLSLDDSSDQAGRVLYGDTDSYLARIGARLTREWTRDDGRKATAWARANLWHAFGDDARTSFPTVAGGPGTMETPLGGTWAQVGVGITGQVSASTRLFASGDYSRTIGGSRGHALAARVGLRYVW